MVFHLQFTVAMLFCAFGTCLPNAFWFAGTNSSRSWFGFKAETKPFYIIVGGQIVRHTPHIIVNTITIKHVIRFTFVSHFVAHQSSCRHMKWSTSIGYIKDDIENGAASVIRTRDLTLTNGMCIANKPLILWYLTTHNLLCVLRLCSFLRAMYRRTMLLTSQPPEFIKVLCWLLP